MKKRTNIAGVLGLIALVVFGVFPARAVSTRIEAWISITNLAITNLPFLNTNSLTYNSVSNRVWTNTIFSAATQIPGTNSIQASRTNLKTQLDTYKFQTWHQVYYGTNTNDVIILAGTNDPIAITIGGVWASVRYVTNTVYPSDFVLVPPTAAQSNNFLTWQWTAVATNLEKSTQAISDTAFPFIKYATTNTAQPLANKTLVLPVILGGSFNGTISDAVFTNGTLWLTSAPSIKTFVMVTTNTIITNAAGSHFYFPDHTIDPTTEDTSAIATVGDIFNYILAGEVNQIAVDAVNTTITIIENAYHTNAQFFGPTNTVRGTLNAATVNIGAGNTTNTYIEASALSAGTITATTKLNVPSNEQMTNIVLYSPTLLGAGGSSVSLANTNPTSYGTNVVSSEMSYTPRTYATAISGYASAINLGTNAYVRITGASAALTNASFKGGYAGLEVLVEFVNPNNSVVLLDHSSIGAPASTEKINTTTGALINNTNNPAVFKLLHNGTEWIVLWPINR